MTTDVHKANAAPGGEDDWEATVDGWKAEIEAMTTTELLAVRPPAANRRRKEREK